MESAFGAALQNTGIAYIDSTAVSQSHACPPEIGYVIDIWKPLLYRIEKTWLWQVRVRVIIITGNSIMSCKMDM